MANENCSPFARPPGPGPGPKSGDPVVITDETGTPHMEARILFVHPDLSSVVLVTDAASELLLQTENRGLGTEIRIRQYPVLAALSPTAIPGKITWRPVPPANPL